MKVYALVKDFNGVRNGIRFINGVGETDDLKLVEWFRTHGYVVEKSKVEIASMEVAPITPVEEVKTVEDTDLPDFESMTPNELRDWGKLNGYSNKIRNIRNKEKLLEILRG